MQKFEGFNQLLIRTLFDTLTTASARKSGMIFGKHDASLQRVRAYLVR